MRHVPRTLPTLLVLSLLLLAVPASAQAPADSTDQVELPDPSEPMVEPEPMPEPMDEPEPVAEPMTEPEPMADPTEDAMTGEGQVNVEGTPRMGGTTEVEMQDTSAELQSSLEAARSRTAFRRVANERLDAYEEHLEHMHDHLETLPAAERADAAYELIRLRRQYDDLGQRQRRMRSGEFEAMRGELTRDLTQFDAELHRARHRMMGEMDVDDGMN
ncbi:MAG: hypothetical protein R3362_03640 [Rhodothermales bacterium]|nr:hypothetical protein [Rhodothermales bacterium]